MFSSRLFEAARLILVEFSGHETRISEPDGSVKGQRRQEPLHLIDRILLQTPFDCERLHALRKSKDPKLLLYRCNGSTSAWAFRGLRNHL